MMSASISETLPYKSSFPEFVQVCHHDERVKRCPAQRVDHTDDDHHFDHLLFGLVRPNLVRIRRNRSSEHNKSNFAVGIERGRERWSGLSFGVGRTRTVQGENLLREPQDNKFIIFFAGLSIIITGPC